MLSAALPLTLALALQVRVQVGTPPAPDTVERRDSVVHQDTVVRDSTRNLARRKIPVTAHHLATAFRDSRARTLLENARIARMRQDSSLASYDAKTYQRVSIGMAFKAIGRERVFARHENSARVRWQRGMGAVIDVTGSRSVMPPFEGENVSADISGTNSIPYYPGRDDLWFGAESVAGEREDAVLIHPIASGAEAYYTYAVGDSVIFRLQDGSQIRLLELRVRPRQPDWRVAVGSLWFDASTAQLVRAVYRLSVPVDFWHVIAMDEEEEDIPPAVRALMRPLTGTVSSLVIEHGLYEGRFWLPRAQIAEAEVQAGFMRIPVRLEERFDYLSVNGDLDSLPPVPARAERRERAIRDSIVADSLGLKGTDRREYYRKLAEERGEGRAACEAGAETRQSSYSRHSGAVPLLVRVPCDTALLVASPDLPPSIYAPGEEMFGQQDLENLKRDVESMLGFDAQAGFSPQRPTFTYGPSSGLLRYNRIEGLSAGLGMRQELGQGLALEARAQIGVADLQPNGELALSRSDGRRNVRIAGYRRLAAANDWGTPLSFGSSLNALVFGRDEGFYYRTMGAELGIWGARDTRFEWRVFAERHDDADVETHFSFANALHGLRFDENIEAEEGMMVGVGGRLTRSWGVDPNGFRLFGDMRVEGGSGDFTFARGAVDLSLSRALGSSVAASLTGSVGSTAGEVPAQRLFYLGGTSTVRGQTPGTMVGNTFWMGRAELGTTRVAARPVVFFDLGWAGDRGDWRNPGRPMSGAGAGMSFMDGLIRFDVARGIWPRERWTAAFYLEALF